MIAADSTAVGSRGTSPVFQYSTSTGAASPTDSSASTALKARKNWNGRSCSSNCTITNRIRMPSCTVRSLLDEPLTRSRYGVVTSAIGMPSSSTCTVISVSISKPVDCTGNDLTKRRDSTR